MECLLIIGGVISFCFRNLPKKPQSSEFRLVHWTGGHRYPWHESPGAWFYPGIYPAVARVHHQHRRTVSS